MGNRSDRGVADREVPGIMISNHHWWLQAIPLTIIGIGMITTGYGMIYAVGVGAVATVVGLGWVGAKVYERVRST